MIDFTATRLAAVSLLTVAALGLSGCDLFESGDSASPTPDTTVPPEESAASSASADEATDEGNDAAAAEDDTDRIATGSARVVFNDMDVYESINLNCDVSDSGMSFDGEMDGPHRGQTFIDGSFGVQDSPNSVGMMMDSGQASFPFWVVQDEDAEGRIVGEFTELEWDAQNSYVSGAASFEAVAEHNVTLTDPPTFQRGTFEIHC